MLSETICSKLAMDSEFNNHIKAVFITERDFFAQSLTKKARSKLTKSKSDLNRAYHDLHRSAFELSVLFSPRAARTPSFMGEFFVTLLSISRLGKVYLSNMLNLINTMKSKSPFKRIDKLKIGLENTLDLLDKLDEDVQQSLDEYLSGAQFNNRKKISEYSKCMLRVRRSYYKIKFKISLLNDCFDYSSLDYNTYGPLMQFVRFKSNPSLKSLHSPVVMEAVLNKPKSKRKEDVDKQNTSFILKHGLPRKLATRLAYSRDSAKI